LRLPIAGVERNYRAVGDLHIKLDGGKGAHGVLGHTIDEELLEVLLGFVRIGEFGEFEPLPVVPISYQY
jgi:hypothetical protein